MLNFFINHFKFIMKQKTIKNALLSLCFLFSGLLFAQKSLAPAAALEGAQATMEACRKAGFQAAVAVVDRGGNMQVMLRDSLLRRLQLLKIDPLKKLIS